MTTKSPQLVDVVSTLLRSRGKYGFGRQSCFKYKLNTKSGKLSVFYIKLCALPEIVNVHGRRDTVASPSFRLVVDVSQDAGSRVLFRFDIPRVSLVDGAGLDRVDHCIRKRLHQFRDEKLLVCKFCGCYNTRRSYCMSCSGRHVLGMRKLIIEDIQQIIVAGSPLYVQSLSFDCLVTWTNNAVKARVTNSPLFALRQYRLSTVVNDTTCGLENMLLRVMRTLEELKVCVTCGGPCTLAGSLSCHSCELSDILSTTRTHQGSGWSKQLKAPPLPE
jgi:hypothetical protein